MLREASTHNAIDMQRYSAIERSLRKPSRVNPTSQPWSNVGGPECPPEANCARYANLRNLPQVTCDNEASQSSTLIEVHALDDPGWPTRSRAPWRPWSWILSVPR